jgi:hypothetical protein
MTKDDKRILICATLRDFKDKKHRSTQINFLKSIKNQSYQNYLLIVTQFFEKDLNKTLDKLNIKYCVIKSKFLKKLYKKKSKFSLWEIVNNSYKFLKKDRNIVIVTLSDIIFDKNFFKTIVDHYEPNYCGTSWPQVNYKNLNNYKRGNIFNIINLKNTYHELMYPLERMMSDAYFFCGNNFLNEKFKKIWNKCKFHGRSDGISLPLFFNFFSNTKRINIYFKSKIHNIHNNTLDNKKREPHEFNVIFYENSLIIDKFVKLMNIPIKYWKKFFSYRKINIFNSYKIKGSINQKILLKLLIIYAFIKLTLVFLYFYLKKILKIYFRK